MIIADLYCRLERRTGIVDPGYSVPVYTIELEFVPEQVVGIADDDAIGLRIDIDHIAWPNRATGQALALADGEKLNAVMFADEISVHIVNLSLMKSRVAQMRAQESFVILAGNETNLLAVDLVGHFQA